MPTSAKIRPVAKPNTDLPIAHVSRIIPQSQIVQNENGHFSSALAHEFRNPLTNINLSIEMLQSTMIHDEQKQFLDIIMRSSVRINDLINEFLKYQEQDKTQAREHSIHQLLDEVLEMAEDRIQLKHITVRKEYSTQDCKIVLNRPKMIMALTNIIINAIDAMSPGKGELSLVTKSMNGRCVIEIADNGIGISKENLKKIFKPYFTNKPKGMGLGLAATLNFLLANDASVNVQSEEGKGTCFTLSFNKIH